VNVFETVRVHWRTHRSPWGLCKRIPPYLTRHWRKRKLKKAYERGHSRPLRNLVVEETDPTIIATGASLKDQLLTANQGKHAASGHRVLMFRPGSITAEIWFGDLARCMRHAGIECRELAPDTSAAQINAEFESFAPNIFIATEATTTLRALDLSFVRDYKRRHGCLRHLIPVWHASAPRAGVPVGHSTPEDEAWRRRLRWEGLTADAHFSIFEPEFHDRFSRDTAGPAIEYAAIPQACNPFVDRPVPAVKSHDYFMATSLSDERIAASHLYVRRILSRYHGLWAGPNWGFGIQHVPPSEMALEYAKSRVALSPLVGFVHLYGAELTHRVYAAAGCGAFQLTMPTPITRRYFEPEELVQAHSPSEFVSLFNHYVDRPLERNAIALAALRRVYSEHTCFHRIDKLVSLWRNYAQRGLF
jgi:hypothetical protein